MNRGRRAMQGQGKCAWIETNEDSFKREECTVSNDIKIEGNGRELMELWSRKCEGDRVR